VGRRATWMTFLLMLAIAFAGLAGTILQVGKDAVKPYVSDPDLAIWILLILAALAFLGSLCYGGALVVEWWKGKPDVSDQPNEPTPPRINTGPISAGPGSIFSIGQTGGHTGPVYNAAPQARTLKGKDKARAIARLKAYQGTVIDISVGLGDQEALGLACEIADLLRAAGWPLTDANVGMGLPPPPPGVSLLWPGTDNPAMMALGQTLIDLGIAAGGVPEANVPSPSLRIGARPAG
jgi:hypothetical protein